MPDHEPFNKILGKSLAGMAMHQTLDVPPVTVNGEQCTVGIALWKDGEPRLEELSTTDKNLRILWCLCETRVAPDWTKVLDRLRAPTETLTVWMPATGLPPKVKRRFSSCLFPYKALLEDGHISCTKWQDAARNCITSFVATNELIPRRVLLSGLSAAPYFLSAKVAEAVVNHCTTTRHLRSVSKTMLFLADTVGPASLWTRDQVARDLSDILREVILEDSSTAASLSAIRWNFRGNASLNDEMGTLVPAWCRLEKKTRSASPSGYGNFGSIRHLVCRLLDLLRDANEIHQTIEERVVAAGLIGISDPQSYKRRLIKVIEICASTLKKDKADLAPFVDALKNAEDARDVSVCDRVLNPLFDKMFGDSVPSSDEDDEAFKAPPPYSPKNGAWVLSKRLTFMLAQLSPRAVTPSQARKGDKVLNCVDQDGNKWGIDQYGVFRRDVGGRNFAAYYVPKLRLEASECYHAFMRIAKQKVVEDRE